MITYGFFLVKISHRFSLVNRRYGIKMTLSLVGRFMCPQLYSKKSNTEKMQNLSWKSNFVYGLILTAFFLFYLSAALEVHEKLATKSRNKLHPCPLCQKQVFNIPRHLRSVRHGLSLSESNSWKVKYRSKINFDQTFRRETKGTDKRPFLGCPLCKKKVTRIDKHLKKIHGLIGNDYLSARALAKVVRLNSDISKTSKT